MEMSGSLRVRAEFGPVLVLVLAAFLATSPAPAQDWTDAFSREMTLLNDPRAFDAPPPDAQSRAVTLLNDPRAFDSAVADALSREWTLLNDPRAFDATLSDALSREVTLLNDPRAFDAAIPDALSREWTIRAGTDPLGAVRRALSIAAGLVAATTADKDTLNVVTTGTSATRIDILDAARLMRRAAGLDP